jgi:cysteine-rich repeat protein
MKTRNTILWNVVVALALLLGAGAAWAQATVVFDDPQDLNKATGILNLNVVGFGTFDVAFDQQAFASQIYGTFPGDLAPLDPFLNLVDTEIAANAVNAALNAASVSVLSVGEVGVPGFEAYNIGARAFICCTLPFIDDDPSIPSIAVIRSLTEGDVDWFSTGENFVTWDLDERDWAVFTVSGAAVCGNGSHEAGEQCDDGNTMSGDGCSDICMLEVQPVCGNGSHEADEQCDDGNTMSGDGCSDICMLEVQPVCGNGSHEPGEQCDDGNTTSGDGCSATCTVEPGQEAQVVFGDSQDPDKATGITNLEVLDFGTFDVAFDQQAFASQIYGTFPGDQVGVDPFLTLAGTETAAAAVNALLNAENVVEIGEVGLAGSEVYNIGAIAFLCCEIPLLPDPDIDSIAVIRSITESGADWFGEENFITWNADERAWAVFTAIPEPSTTLLSVAALATLGLIRRKRRKGSEGTA